MQRSFVKLAPAMDFGCSSPLELSRNFMKCIAQGRREKYVSISIDQCSTVVPQALTPLQFGLVHLWVQSGFQWTRHATALEETRGCSGSSVRLQSRCWQHGVSSRGSSWGEDQTDTIRASACRLSARGFPQFHTWAPSRQLINIEQLASSKLAAGRALARQTLESWLI